MDLPHAVVVISSNEINCSQLIHAVVVPEAKGAARRREARRPHDLLVGLRAPDAHAWVSRMHVDMGMYMSM